MAICRFHIWYFLGVLLTLSRALLHKHFPELASSATKRPAPAGGGPKDPIKITIRGATKISLHERFSRLTRDNSTHHALVDEEELGASAYSFQTAPRAQPPPERSRPVLRPALRPMAMPYRPRTASNPPAYSRGAFADYYDGDEDEWDDYEEAEPVPIRARPMTSMRPQQQPPWRPSSRGLSKLQSMRLALGIADDHGAQLSHRLGYEQHRRPFVRRLGSEGFRSRSFFAASPFRWRSDAPRIPRSNLYQSRQWTSLISLASDGTGVGRRPQRRSFGYNPRTRGGGRWRSGGMHARGRGRGRRRGGGRGGGRHDAPPPSKEELDQQLDDYMAKTRGALDKDLDAYMTVSA